MQTKDNQNGNGQPNLFEEDLFAKGMAENPAAPHQDGPASRPAPRPPARPAGGYVYKGSAARRRQGAAMPPAVAKPVGKRRAGKANKRASAGSNKGKIVFASIMAVCAAVFIFSLVRIIGILSVYNTADAEYDSLVESFVAAPAMGENGGTAANEADPLPQDEQAAATVIDFDGLQAINSDFAAWLYYPGTVVNYPVARGQDNEYYLNYTFNKTKNASGSIFMDTRCNADFSSYHTILYGHNVKSGSMFGGLYKLADSSYLAGREYIYVYMPNATYVYKVVFAMQTDAYSPLYTVDFASEADFAAFCAENGIEGSGQLLTLSTCVTGSDRDARFIVCAQLEKTLPPSS